MCVILTCLSRPSVFDQEEEMKMIPMVKPDVQGRLNSSTMPWQGFDYLLVTHSQSWNSTYCKENRVWFKFGRSLARFSVGPQAQMKIFDGAFSLGHLGLLKS